MQGLAARALLFTGLAVLVALPGTGALAQQGRDTAIAQRLNDIERTLQDLQRAVYRGDVPPPRSSAPQT